MTENTGRGGRGRGGRGGRGRGGRGRGEGRGGRGGEGRGGRGRGKAERKEKRRQRQQEAEAKKAADEDAYFRQCQIEAKKQKESGNKAKLAKDDTSKEREEELFGKQMVTGINFEKYNEIKVDVKVPNKKKIGKPMENFANLKHLTPQLKKNIELMKYSQPTPIQKNAIPQAMAGEDLMCCAQTGSGRYRLFTCCDVSTVKIGASSSNEFHLSLFFKEKPVPFCCLS